MASKNLTEGSLEKALVAIRIDVSLKRKVMKKYGGNGKSVSEAFRAMIEDAVSDVQMGRKDMVAVEEEVKSNYCKRMDKRKIERRHPREDRIKDYSKYH